MADYVPDGDAAFDVMFGNLCSYVEQMTEAKEPVWTHIPQARVNLLIGAFNVWHAAFEAMQKPHTKVETEAKKDAKKAGRAELRPFVNQYLRFPPVTNEDRTAMGVHNPDTHPTPVKPPEAGPVFSIVQLGPGRLGVTYRTSEHGRKGSKPRGVLGARIYYGLPDTPPTDQRLLANSVWATRCPHGITFRESDRGKRAFFALKWEIRRENGESPWSEIQSEIVP